MVTHFIIKYEKKITFFVNTTIDLIRKVFTLQEADKIMVADMFPKTQIFT